MSIPVYSECLLPLLRYAGESAEPRSIREATDALASYFQLSEDDRNSFLPSGQQTVFRNRVGWANTYMKKAGLLSSPRRGMLQITERGKVLLKDNPQKLDRSDLERFPEFIEFITPTRDDTEVDSHPPDSLESSQTPHEAIDAAFERLNIELATEILANIKDSNPSLFEGIVVELLVKMGYGGNRQDAGRAIGRSGDEGIDGIIKEDHLGLDNIYIQAKRWESVVGRPEIQKFAGALQGQRARKGVFITTSDFTKEARDFVSRIDSKIILINGSTLAKLMIEFGVGVTSVATYQVKKIDSDYFAEV